MSAADDPLMPPEADRPAGGDTARHDAQDRATRPYVRIDECRTSDDLDRLDPRDYARLAATPASQLDLLAVRLDVRDAIEQLADQLGRQFSGELGRTFFDSDAAPTAERSTDG